MYNPEGDDNNKEFIEIYSDEKINLSDFIIGDSDSNDTLNLLQSSDSDYYLITEEGFNLSGIVSSVYSAGSAIGDNLNNNGDSVFLYYNLSLINNVSYSDICYSGYSLEYFNGSFYCSFYLGGTPGRQNSAQSIDYSSIIINELLPDPSGDDNAPIPDGEFIELYNPGDDTIELAGLYFLDSADHKLHVSDTTTINGTIIHSKGYLAVYTNGLSGFLNNDGFEDIGLYDPYGNRIDKVTYSGSGESMSWALVNSLWKYRLPTPDEKNPSNDVTAESSFRIEGLEDIDENDKIEFGDIIKVKFYVYKGNTTKSSIKLYVENNGERISKIAKAELPDKYTNYTLVLPLQLNQNCNQEYDDGDYYINLGWTSSSQIEDSFKIKVEGIDDNNCNRICAEAKPKKGALINQLTESPLSVESNRDFNVKVELTNNDESDHMVDIYSYIYRGSKCYSPDREANKKSILLRAYQTKEVELENLVSGAEPGDYNLKVRIKRDDQKTEKEITKPIQVLQQSVVEPVEVKETQEKTALSEEGNEDYATILESAKQPKIIYESPSEKSKKLAVYFFMGLLVAYSSLLTYMVYKK